MDNTLFGLPQPVVITFIIILSIWQLAVKAVAIWRAAQFKQRNWFLALFILIPFNDLGILELIFLFRFAKKRLTVDEARSWFSRNKS